MEAIFAGATAPFPEPLLSTASEPVSGAARWRPRGRQAQRRYFVLPKYLSNCLCTSASMLGFNSDSMKPSSQSRRTASLPTWSAPVSPGRLNSM